MSFSIGVISDTHGLLRPEVIQFLRSCDTIIHAGDIGSKELYDELNSIGETYAVKGNVDWEPWKKDLPLNEFVEIHGKYFYITHIFEDIVASEAANVPKDIHFADVLFQKYPCAVPPP